MVTRYIPQVAPAGVEADSYYMQNWNRQIQEFCKQTVDVSIVMTSAFTCREYEFYPCTTSGGAFAVQLPPALGVPGLRYTIKNYDGANIITVTADTTKPDDIDGAATHAIPATAGIAYTYVADGYSRWYVDCCDSGGGAAGIGGITVEEEGVGVGAAAGITTVNFVGGTVTATGAGAGATITIAAAPLDATFVTLSTNATLTNERVLTAGGNITLTDAGAGSTITVATNLGVAPGITMGQAVALVAGLAGP